MYDSNPRGEPARKRKLFYRQPRIRHLRSRRFDKSRTDQPFSRQYTRYPSAVNLLANELSKNFYLNLKTEHQIDVAFQKGNITVNRVKHNILDIREKVLKMYYNEIVAPNLRKAFIDDDFNKCTKMYLVGGGALYPELVDCFKEEFGDIVSVNVYPEPEKCASQRYCLNSKIKSSVARSNIPHNIEAEEIKIFRNPQLAVGIDIGNANTCVTIYKEGE